MAIYCNRCAASNKDGSRFCRICGNQLTGNNGNNQAENMSAKFSEPTVLLDKNEYNMMTDNSNDKKNKSKSGKFKRNLIIIIIIILLVCAGAGAFVYYKLMSNPEVKLFKAFEKTGHADSIKLSAKVINVDQVLKIKAEDSTKEKLAKALIASKIDGDYLAESNFVLSGKADSWKNIDMMSGFGFMKFDLAASNLLFYSDGNSYSYDENDKLITTTDDMTDKEKAMLDALAKRDYGELYDASEISDTTGMTYDEAIDKLIEVVKGSGGDDGFVFDSSYDDGKYEYTISTNKLVQVFAKNFHFDPDDNDIKSAIDTISDYADEYNVDIGDITKLKLRFEVEDGYVTKASFSTSDNKDKADGVEILMIDVSDINNEDACSSDVEKEIEDRKAQLN